MVLKHQQSPIFILLISIKLYQGTSFRRSHGRSQIAFCFFGLIARFISVSINGELSFWSGVLLDKLIVARLANKFFTLYGS